MLSQMDKLQHERVVDEDEDEDDYDGYPRVQAQTVVEATKHQPIDIPQRPVLQSFASRENVVTTSLKRPAFAAARPSDQAPPKRPRVDYSAGRNAGE